MRRNRLAAPCGLIALAMLLTAPLAVRSDTLLACKKGQRIRLRSECRGKEIAMLDVAALNQRVAELEAVLGPPCGETRSQCNGHCPKGQVCSNIDSAGCLCLPGPTGCNGDLYPSASNTIPQANACQGGTCPSPRTCRIQAGFCYCG